MTAVDPAVDLLDSAERGAHWWELEMTRLPRSPVPDPTATRRLRAAIRDLFDAHLEHRSPQRSSIEDVNAVAASVPTSPRLVYAETGDPGEDTRWHTERGGNPALAAIAREAIDLLADLERVEQAAPLRQPDLRHAVPGRDHPPAVVREQRLRQPEAGRAALPAHARQGAVRIGRMASCPLPDLPNGVRFRATSRSRRSPARSAGSSAVPAGSPAGRSCRSAG